MRAAASSVNSFMKRHDKAVAAGLAVPSLLFVVAMFTVPPFMEWAFARHENTLSWFVRPLFLIPFCLFALHRSRAGLSLTVLLVLTSMFWFPQPAETDPRVKAFLAFEKDYLRNDWNAGKIAMTLLVPGTLTLLAVSFWRRSLRLGLSTLAAIAVMKSLWSVLFAGESGTAAIAPAAIGLLACCVFVLLGVRTTRRRGER